MNIKNLFSKKPVKITAGIVVIAVVGIGVYYSPIVQNKVVAASVAGQKTAVVKKGNIDTLVSGTGSMYYDKESILQAKVNSTVTKVYFKEGDRVKAGDIICEFDDTNEVLGMNQKKNALTQSQLSSNSNSAEINKLIVKTPFTGQVSNIVVKKDDTVQKGSPLFTIADTSKLKLTADFNSADISKLSLNQAVEVYITSMMQSVQGTVTYKSNKPVSTSTGGQLYTIEIQINNPGGISEGMTANVSLETGNGTISSTNTGELEYVNKTTVLSETNGTIDNVSIKKNQQINGGVAVIKIKNDDIVRSKEIGDLKISDSEIAIAASEKQLSYYKIYALIDGVVAKQDIKVGDNIAIGQTVAVIKETDVVQVDVDIDELDIAKVALGQKAKINVDALPETVEKPIEGEVIKIAVDGISKNGVTNFPVTVRVKERQNILKGGMNSTAEIQVASLSNSLYIPKAAIVKANGKSTVTVMPEQAAASTKKKDKLTTVKEIETGVSNDSVIEVKSGLKEGDIIVLP